MELSAENEIFRVTKEEKIPLPMNGWHPKQSTKVTKILSEYVEIQYLCISIHVKSFFRVWCVNEVAGLQPLYRQPWQNWCFSGDVVTESGVIVFGWKMVSPHPPQMVAYNGQLYTPILPVTKGPFSQ